MILYNVPAFQFHKGTIKPLKRFEKTLNIINFNSIKVRLNLCSRAHSVGVNRHFNSIKVRLNQLYLVVVQILFVFQFHKGTIKPANTFSKISTSSKFQFHKGTIKPPLTWCGEVLPRYFNSIKVRLNHRHT